MPPRTHSNSTLEEAGGQMIDHCASARIWGMIQTASPTGLLSADPLPELNSGIFILHCS
jgi:hypothetical protein